MADPESSESLNPADPGDAKLLSLKNSIESSPGWAEKKAAIEKENFISPGTSDKTNSAPPNRDDLRNAALKSAFESGAPAPAAGGARDVQHDTQEFGRILGVAVGTAEFDTATANFQSWYDEVSSHPEFDQIVAKAEGLFGTEAVLRAAHQMAGEHARKARR